MILKSVILIVGAIVSGSECLDPYTAYSEGSCSRIKAQEARVNLTIVSSFNHISGGSRYHLQRLASPLPNYNAMREDIFVNEFCGLRNISKATEQNSTVTITGFGVPLTSYEIRPLMNDQEGVLLVPLFNQPSWDTVRATVTLTDNKEFIFNHVCWTSTDQVGWELLTRTGKVSSVNKRVIEEHAKRLGFKLKNVVFLGTGNCVDTQSYLGSNDDLEFEWNEVDNDEDIDTGPRRINILGAIASGKGLSLNVVRGPEIEDVLDSQLERLEKSKVNKIASTRPRIFGEEANSLGSGEQSSLGSSREKTDIQFKRQSFLNRNDLSGEDTDDHDSGGLSLEMISSRAERRNNGENKTTTTTPNELRNEDVLGSKVGNENDLGWGGRY